MHPTLLCYNLTGERLQKIRHAAMMHSIHIKTIPAEDYTKPLSYLCKLTSAPETLAPEGTFTDEMLVMAGFPDALAGQFLQTLRRLKLAPVHLKAILTDVNKDWNSVQLHQELCEEREAVLRHAALVHAERQQP